MRFQPGSTALGRSPSTTKTRHQPQRPHSKPRPKALASPSRPQRDEKARLNDLSPTAVQGEPVDPEDAAVADLLNAAARRLGDGNGAEAAAELFAVSRKQPRWRLFRGELWRDAERAIGAVAAGRAATMATATASIRQRVSNTGRKLPKRTVSTPLLLKGLEFDHVVIPDATHFAVERQAQAKLFYVAISRATRSLTISSSQRVIKLPPAVR